MALVGAIEYSEPRGDVVYIKTTPCVVCGTQYELIVSRIGYEAWQYGAKIQDVLPELKPEQREILISGTCNHCFDELFPPPED